MKLNTKKRIAADVLKCSPKRVKFDEERLDEIKDAITKADIRSLIKDKAITRLQKRGVSRARARKIHIQKTKGRRKGHGSRKGKTIDTKRQWINKIRVQKSFLKRLRDKKLIDRKTYRSLYMKAKGGFFRSKRHIKVYLEELNLIQRKQ